MAKQKEKPRENWKGEQKPKLKILADHDQKKSNMAHWQDAVRKRVEGGRLLANGKKKKKKKPKKIRSPMKPAMPDQLKIHVPLSETAKVAYKPELATGKLVEYRGHIKKKDISIKEERRGGFGGFLVRGENSSNVESETETTERTRLESKNKGRNSHYNHRKRLVWGSSNDRREQCPLVDQGEVGEQYVCTQKAKILLKSIGRKKNWCVGSGVTQKAH